MVQINIHEAKTHLSRFLQRVAGGEEIIIARDGRPVARLIPFHAPKGARLIGRGKGDFRVRADFDAPLPDKLLGRFGR